MTTAKLNSAHRIGCLAYGAIVYLIFLGTFCYAAGFVGNFLVPKGINDGTVGPLSAAVAVNVLLMGLFAVQHAIMARPWFKKKWTQIIPVQIERSTFVLATCLVLGLLFWQWRPMPEIVWSVENTAARIALHAMFALGFLIVLYASFCIDHFDLFGLRQVVLHLRGKQYTHPGFAMPWLYKLVRNPLMLGFLVAFWSAPTMTQGRLLFAIVTTAYIFVGINLEERDLGRALGDDYRRYRARTPMVLPIPRPRRGKVGELNATF